MKEDTLSSHYHPFLTHFSLFITIVPSGDDEEEMVCSTLDTPGCSANGSSNQPASLITAFRSSFAASCSLPFAPLLFTYCSIRHPLFSCSENENAGASFFPLSCCWALLCHAFLPPFLAGVVVDIVCMQHERERKGPTPQVCVDSQKKNLASPLDCITSYARSSHQPQRPTRKRRRERRSESLPSLLLLPFVPLISFLARLRARQTGRQKKEEKHLKQPWVPKQFFRGGFFSLLSFFAGTKA